MIALQPVAERLKAKGVPRIEGVLEYSALSAAPPLLPAHFVTPLDESAAANRLAAGVIDQRVSFQFQVVTIVQASAARSALPSEELGEQVRLVKAALLGWMLPGTVAPIELAGGRLLSAGGREAVWSTRFRTAYHERTATQ